MKWKLRVLLYKNKENSDHKLLRFFVQGHLGANKNVALDVDKLLLIMFERVEKIRSLLASYQKKGGKKLGWHVLVITARKREAAMKFSFKDDSRPSFKCRRIDDLLFFLEKLLKP